MDRDLEDFYKKLLLELTQLGLSKNKTNILPNMIKCIKALLECI